MQCDAMWTFRPLATRRRAVPAQMWQVRVPVPGQMWRGRAESLCRCGGKYLLRGFAPLRPDGLDGLDDRHALPHFAEDDMPGKNRRRDPGPQTGTANRHRPIRECFKQRQLCRERCHPRTGACPPQAGGADNVAQMTCPRIHAGDACHVCAFVRACVRACACTCTCLFACCHALPIQPGRLGRAQKELRSVGVRPRVGHRQHP